jgi:hypothetical protein
VLFWVTAERHMEIDAAFCIWFCNRLVLLFAPEHFILPSGISQDGLVPPRVAVTAAAGMHSHADFRLASRVFSSDAKRMSQARTNSLLTPRTQPRIFAMLTTPDLVRRTNVSIRIGRPVAPTAVIMFPTLPVKSQVGKVKLGIRALEYYDPQARAGVHSREQTL